MKSKAETLIARILRILLVFSVILMQLMLTYALVHSLWQNALIAFTLIEALSVINTLVLVSRNPSSPFTSAWVLIILLLPVFGYILYILWGRQGRRGKRKGALRASIQSGFTKLTDSPGPYAALEAQNPTRKRIAHYLKNEGFPLYQNTLCTYYPLGEEMFDALIADLERAKKFIFMEYYILHAGALWDRLSAILIKKAAEGVEIRILYDDWGNMLNLPDELEDFEEKYGVRVVCFNPIHRYISRLYINYRNHQKITVIDGNIAYTGGPNIADEYANIISRFGHWKDTALRLEGDAVWSLTVMFLQLFDGQTRERSEYERYRPAICPKAGGFVQPFADGPNNNPNNPAELMFRQMISNAREYLYITTPYLIPDSIMADMLCTAAVSGVDVRIITPKIGDSWIVQQVTQSNYGRLLRSGVKLYKYTPGFIHAKTILSDDDHALTGSINMDYRSFHFHYENGVWLAGHPALEDIKRDMLETLARCEEVSYDEWKKRPLHIKIAQGFFRIFAVML